MVIYNALDAQMVVRFECPESSATRWTRSEGLAPVRCRPSPEPEPGGGVTSSSTIIEGDLFARGRVGGGADPRGLCMRGVKKWLDIGHSDLGSQLAASKMRCGGRHWLDEGERLGYSDGYGRNNLRTCSSIAAMFRCPVAMRMAVATADKMGDEREQREHQLHIEMLRQERAGRRQAQGVTVPLPVQRLRGLVSRRRTR